VLPGRTEPDRLYELMAAEQVTLAAAVPTVWLTLLDYMDSKGLRFDRCALPWWPDPSRRAPWSRPSRAATASKSRNAGA
jgi:hypothetical protein